TFFSLFSFTLQFLLLPTFRRLEIPINSAFHSPPMQDFIGSVRRSFVFRPPESEGSSNSELSPPVALPLVDKINSCIRKSRIFTKPSPSSLPAPPPIRYRKGELIGCGAFGHVYMGMNLDSGELLAIKQVLIPANGASKEKAQAHVRELEEEVKLLKNLSHSNIVRYLGTVREEASLNILLEFVPGGSISSLLGKFGPFPEAVIRTYTEQLLLGLEYLHNNGIMHRDIKGANILVDNKGCIKLADFGASKQVVELATMTGAKSMKGTPYWMAPEVIRQTGHSFSADIWSVGCTVIEMATGKPPWSQKYEEVAALFHIGSTKSHPEIPEHLSDEAKDFLLKCLQKEPNMRLNASELLKHPFVTGKHGVPDTTSLTPQSKPTHVDINFYTLSFFAREVPSVSGSGDLCNLGSINCSINLQNSGETQHLWGESHGDDDMCQVDSDFSTSGSNQNPILTSGEFCTNQNLDHGFVGDLMGKFDECIEPEQEVRICSEEPAQFNRTLSSEVSLFEDDDGQPAESKIKAFLDDKALELKKLQTPLYEEFYNSMIATSSPNLCESLRLDTPSPNYLKLPPKSKSPSRVPVKTSSPVTDAACTESPGSTGRSMANVDNANDEASKAVSSPHIDEQKGLFVDAQSESSSPGLRQRKWKEELVEELERKRGKAIYLNHHTSYLMNSTSSFLCLLQRSRTYMIA
ncbi:Mitogen-activated protein kinase kinase kinase ANP1, partial [Linum perenne]